MKIWNPVSFEQTIRCARSLLEYHPCEAYDTCDRHGILMYRKRHKYAQDLYGGCTLGLASMLRATTHTYLETPLHVFCEDTLEGFLDNPSLDMRIKLRFLLGRIIRTYEELIRWYLMYEDFQILSKSS